MYFYFVGKKVSKRKVLIPETYRKSMDFLPLKLYEPLFQIPLIHHHFGGNHVIGNKFPNSSKKAHQALSAEF